MRAQMIGVNSFPGVWNATPRLSIIHYVNIPSTTPACVHSSSIFHCHHNYEPVLYDHLRMSRFCRGEHKVKCVGVAQDTNCDDDKCYMRRSIEIARKAIGHTSPNPMVGCVIVKNGKIVGEGFHPKAGQPHAEVFALREAGDLAENATAYVTLEPCNHHGRTPPCTDALIKAKVKRVVVGMVDPNPIVASKGLDRLREAGIDVTVRMEEHLCKKLNEAYIHQMLTGKPLLTLRYSISINGCILSQVGIGVSETGGYYSQLLQEYNAVLISPNSSTEEFEIPVSKENGAKQPVWIILSSPNGLINLPRITDATAKVIVLTDNELVGEQNLTQQGIETIVLDRLNLSRILDYCKRRGFCSVLWDVRGNFGIHGELLKEGIEQEMLQKVVAEVLPQWNESPSGNSTACIKTSVDGLKLKNLQSRISGQSVILEGCLEYKSY